MDVQEVPEGLAMTAEGMRLVLRLTPEQAALIRRAAAIEGLSITGFTVAATMAQVTVELSPELSSYVVAETTTVTVSSASVHPRSMGA